MAATLTDVPTTAELEPLYRALPRGQRAADGLTAEQVAADQRRRLHGAMIEVVTTDGYAAAGTRRLARLAAMSKQDMYRHFPSKERYFLATYDMIVGRAVDRVGGAYVQDGDWQLRLRRAFQQLAAEVVEEPQAARFALAEVLGSGPAGLQRMERTRAVFERMVGASFAQAPEGVALPPILVKGIVRGVERVIRQRLLSGREYELPALADELLAWALCYQSPALAELCESRSAGAPLRCCSRPLALRTSDERIRILRVAAQIAAKGGYARLTHGQIAYGAGVTESVVRERCGDVQECFLGALELLSVEALIGASTAAREAGDRLAGVHRGIAALMERVARDRALCRIAFVEVFALGPPAIERREALLAKFTDQLVNSLPADSRPSPPVAEAIVGAIWGIVHHHVTRGEAHLLPALADQIAYLALAPGIGGQDAVSVILDARASSRERALASAAR
ncbi:MAG TPA: TetR/AcrR family transcriptional regulator [Solirubrobacteraceae bacterium]